MGKIGASVVVVAKKVLVPSSLGHAICLSLVLPGGFIALGWYLVRKRKPPTKEEIERSIRRMSQEIVGRGAV